MLSKAVLNKRLAPAALDYLIERTKTDLTVNNLTLVNILARNMKDDEEAEAINNGKAEVEDSKAEFVEIMSNHRAK